MSGIAVEKPGIQLFVPKCAGVWTRFKWLLPILTNVVVAMTGCAPSDEVRRFSHHDDS
jgi:hypothetical protein